MATMLAKFTFSIMSNGQMHGFLSDPKGAAVTPAFKTQPGYNKPVSELMEWLTDKFDVKITKPKAKHAPVKAAWKIKEGISSKKPKGTKKINLSLLEGGWTEPMVPKTGSSLFKMMWDYEPASLKLKVDEYGNPIPGWAKDTHEKGAKNDAIGKVCKHSKAWFKSNGTTWMCVNGQHKPKGWKEPADDYGMDENQLPHKWQVIHKGYVCEWKTPRSPKSNAWCSDQAKYKTNGTVKQDGFYGHKPYYLCSKHAAQFLVPKVTKKDKKGYQPKYPTIMGQTYGTISDEMAKKFGFDFRAKKMKSSEWKSHELAPLHKDWDFSHCHCTQHQYHLGMHAWHSVGAGVWHFWVDTTKTGDII